jgi:hypothetical protein
MLANDGSGNLTWTPLPSNSPPTLASLGLDWSQTNSVTTNAIALKVPVLTNGGTVFYLMLTTNVP